MFQLLGSSVVDTDLLHLDSAQHSLQQPQDSRHWEAHLAADGYPKYRIGVVSRGGGSCLCSTQGELTHGTNCSFSSRSRSPDVQSILSNCQSQGRASQTKAKPSNAVVSRSLSCLQTQKLMTMALFIDIWKWTLSTKDGNFKSNKDQIPDN